MHEEFNSQEDANSSQNKFYFIQKTLHMSNAATENNFVEYFLKQMCARNVLSKSTRSCVDWTLDYMQQLIDSKLDTSRNFTQFVASEFKAAKIDTIEQTDDKKILKLKAEKQRQKMLSKFNKLQQKFVESNRLETSSSTSKQNTYCILCRNIEEDCPMILICYIQK